jgi:hypothetical protein
MLQNSTYDTPSLPRRIPAWPLPLLVLIWTVMAVAAWPAGEFPLNDDWSYSLPVRSILQEGRLTLSGWTSMPLIAQVAWGALFCAPFGFSYLALRLSTLVLGFLGLAATYGFAREAGASRKAGVFAALALAVNPVFFLLANTFMTDVPFLSTAMISLFLLARGMNTSKPSLLASGILAAAAATLIRQAGLVIPVAFCVAFLWKNRPLSRRTILLSACSLAAVAVPLLIYNRLLDLTGSTPALYHAKTTELAARLHAPLSSACFWAGNVASSAVYLGLFLLPVLLAIPRPPTEHQIRHHVTTILLALTATALLILTGHPMPLFGNILYNLGLGPIRLHDVHTLGLPHWPTAPSWMPLLLTFVALLSALYALPRLVLQFRKAPVEHRPALILAIVASVLYLAPLAMIGMFDRYLLLLIPLLGSVTCAGTDIPDRHASPVFQSAAVLVLLSFLTFSVCATRDCFAWNRARWTAARELMDKQHIPSTRIDGGFEFNGLYGYHHAAPDGSSRPTGRKRSWWWVRDDEYILAMGPVPGYDVISRHGFVRIIPPGHGEILVLHRKSVDQE